MPVEEGKEDKSVAESVATVQYKKGVTRIPNGQTNEFDTVDINELDTGW